MSTELQTNRAGSHWLILRRGLGHSCLRLKTKPGQRISHGRLIIGQASCYGSAPLAIDRYAFQHLPGTRLLGLPVVSLPSSSPASAGMRLLRKGALTSSSTWSPTPATDYPLIFLQALLSARNYIPAVSCALCHPVRMQIPMTLSFTSAFPAHVTVSDTAQTHLLNT